MKYILGLLLICILLSQACLAEDLSTEEVVRIKKALRVGLSFDNYWFSKWCQNKDRNLRIISIGNSKYLIDLEVLEKDSIKNMGDDQIAIVNLSGFGSILDYPEGQPYTLESLKNNYAKHRFFGILEKVKNENIEIFLDTNKCYQSTFSLVNQPRDYRHDKEWELMIKAIEGEIIADCKCLSVGECIYLIHDLISTDDTFYGMVFINNGKENKTITGSIHRTESEMYRYQCSLRSNRLNEIDSRHVKYLSQILTRPLIWHVKIKDNKQFEIQKISGWQCIGSP